MNRKTIIWVLIILGGLFAIERYFKSLKKEAFETVLIRVDTSVVDAIKISTPLEDDPMVFVKTASSWIVSKGNTSVKAMEVPMNHLLGEISQISVSQIISDRSASWVDFGVGQDQGVRIEIFSDQEKLEDFVLGSVKTEDGNNSLESYIRLFDQKEIYAVKDKQLVYCTLPLDDYRQKKLIQWPATFEITSIKLQYVDTLFQFSYQNNTWMEKENLLFLDSIGVPHYIKELKSISGGKFADDFDETAKEDLFYQSLTFSSSNGMEPLIINCYRDSTRENSFILHSCVYPDSWFESDSTGIFEKVFTRLEQLIR